MKRIKFITLFLSKLISRYLKRQSFKDRVTYGFNNRQTGRQKYLWLGVIFILLGVLTWRIWFTTSPNTVSQGLIGSYNAHNLPPSVTNLISEPLLKLDKSGQPQPNLVSGWQVNNDATLYTFKLKENLFWNDGTAVKASDLKFNLTDVEITYPDDQTIEFKLADSFYPFPTLLTNPVFKGETLTGVGKFRVIHQDQSRGLITKLILTPQSQERKSPENFLQIIIRFYPDEKTARIAFDLGEIESLMGVSEVESFQDQSQVKLRSITNYNKIVAVFFNVKDTFLSDKNMRRALAAASPKIGGEERAKTPIPPTSWAFNDTVKDIQGDREIAKSYLNKVQVPQAKESSIILTTTPALASYGEKIIQSWKEAGISAVLRVESGIPQNFQALLISQLIPSDPDQYALWHSTQTKTNISQFSSPRVDKDLEDGRKIADTEKRREKYLDFQKVLQDDAPATFLYFPKTNIVYRKKVEQDLKKILSLQFH